MRAEPPTERVHGLIISGKERERERDAAGFNSGVTYLSYTAAVGNGAAAHTPTHTPLSLSLYSTTRTHTHSPGAQEQTSALGRRERRETEGGDTSQTGSSRGMCRIPLRTHPGCPALRGPLR